MELGGEEEHTKSSGPSDGLGANVRGPPAEARDRDVQIDCRRLKLAVQRRYNLNLFLSVLTGSLQGFAERPLPCSYNVIPSVIALSRR